MRYYKTHITCYKSRLITCHDHSIHVNVSARKKIFARYKTEYLRSEEGQSVIYKTHPVKTLNFFLCWVLKMRLLLAPCLSATLFVLIAIHGAKSGTALQPIVPILPDLKLTANQVLVFDRIAGSCRVNSL